MMTSKGARRGVEYSARFVSHAKSLLQSNESAMSTLSVCPHFQHTHPSQLNSEPSHHHKNTTQKRMQTMAHQSPPTKRQRPSPPQVEWRLYPSPRTFLVGSRVFARSKSAKELGRRGTVVVDGTVAANDDDGKVMVQLDANQSKRIATKRLLPIFELTTTSLVLVTPETTSYRNLASSQLDKSAVVLEIGCSTGEASVILCKYGREWIGFDTSDSMVARCKANLSDDNAKAFKVDALGDPDRATKLVADELEHGPPSVVFLDIGGNRECEGVLRMVDWVLNTFSGDSSDDGATARKHQPLLVVIKSRELHAKLKGECTITDGEIVNGSTFIQEQLQRLDRKMPSHPLQAPMRRRSEGYEHPICRYHNYIKDGCKRHKNGKQCVLDHDYCHMCLKEGHVALQCPSRETK